MAMLPDVFVPSQPLIPGRPSRQKVVSAIAANTLTTRAETSPLSPFSVWNVNDVRSNAILFIHNADLAWQEVENHAISASWNNESV